MKKVGGMIFADEEGKEIPSWMDKEGPPVSFILKSVEMCIAYNI
jgi:hypothetical protein